MKQEAKGRDALIKFLNRDLKNNNKGEVITHTSDGKTVRPDSIGKNADGKIDLVHDHKHFMDTTEDQVIYNDEQMRTEKDMIQTGDGKHVVTMSSDNAHLNEIPP